MKDFETEANLDGKSAWFGHVHFYSPKSLFVFKHKLKHQRQVKCKHCGIRIPKEVPRVLVTGWYFYSGHVCLKCASEIIAEDIKAKDCAVTFLQSNIISLNSLLEIIKRIKDSEEYKDHMSIHILNQKLLGE